MNEADLFFELMPKKDTELILNDIANDIKKAGINDHYFHFLVNLIDDDIKTFSKYEPRLLSLLAQNIASLLLN